MFSRIACSRKSGVVSIRTLRPPYSINTDGRVRRSRGSLEWHTAQSQPIVGTPIEVPLPSTVSVAFILSSGGDLLRAFRNRVGHFHVRHAHFVKRVLQEIFFFGSEIAFGFLADHS